MKSLVKTILLVGLVNWDLICLKLYWPCEKSSLLKLKTRFYIYIFISSVVRKETNIIFFVMNYKNTTHLAISNDMFHQNQYLWSLFFNILQMLSYQENLSKTWVYHSCYYHYCCHYYHYLPAVNCKAFLSFCFTKGSFKKFLFIKMFISSGVCNCANSSSIKK